ncbi:MAG: cupin domain-containing protein [Gemmatimonadota bacterium]|nr:cupin domain-containing protein [Gemmatimonadota bacterium]MDH3421902.1 cupin domain-containing protein [Gemmatimonadota bacterium]
MLTLESDALAWILDEPDSTDFVATHLGKTWLHARNEDRIRFADLLSLAQLDEILGTYGIRHPTVRVVRADQDVPAAEYVWRDSMVDPVQVARLFASGSTVIFGSLHDRHEGMRRLSAGLARQAFARTQTNIYLTPPDSQGFKPHWDTHDVLVLQVEGSKRWRIYGGGPETPLKDQKFDPEQHEPGAVEAEFTLEAGEVLYIPRGIMHAAVTTDTVSLHITLGVIAYTWADFVVDCLSEVAERSPDWRANVPFGASSLDADGKEMTRRLRDMLEDLESTVDVGAVLAERQRSFDDYFRPRATDLLRQATGSAGLEETHQVQWRPGMPGSLEQRNGRVVVVSLGREVDFPAAATRTLESLLKEEPVRAGDVDDGLDWESRRVVISALMREGFVMTDGEYRG